ncbi:hypothetical protein [Baekduia sp. Peel2402]|uniref:hypothetical protein n=1 Tax=Baekduia sp. Peel2402 TaxID=3458296 RepID=UPI00403EA82A
MRLARTLLAAVVVLVTAPSAGACVLAGPLPTPDQQVQRSDVVFTGTVSTSDPQFAGGFAMTVKVDRVLKGQVPSEVQLVSGMTSCSAPLKAGERRAFAMKPTTPAPWDLNVYDLADAAAFDALPADVAFAPLAIRALATRPQRARVQIHVKARACTTLRVRVTETVGMVTLAVRGADGPRCTTGARRDRCITLTARRAVGSRTVSPLRARRVGTAKRCPALAS